MLAVEGGRGSVVAGRGVFGAGHGARVSRSHFGQALGNALYDQLHGELLQGGLARKGVLDGTGGQPAFRCYGAHGGAIEALAAGNGPHGFGNGFAASALVDDLGHSGVLRCGGEISPTSINGLSF